MKKWLPPALLTTLFVLFRLPALMNPGYINSDGAIAGLQASTMLAGEWQWEHWGRDYLTSFDSVVAALFFALFGATPVVLMWVTLLGQLTFTLLGYSIVARRLNPWAAFLTSLPLVFMTMALNMYLFFNVRQWCMGLVLLACLVLDRAAESARPRAMLITGVVLSFVALFIDLFASQFVPALILFALLSSLDGTLNVRARVPRLLAVVAGAGLGVGVLFGLRWLAQMHSGRARLYLSLIPTNWPLLSEQCLPWLIGAKTFVLNEASAIEPANSPTWLLPVQPLAALVFVGALCSGALLFFVQRIPWRVRVLGAFGAAASFTSFAGFLMSSTIQDIMGARMLMPVVLTLPFTLAPLAFLAGPRLAVFLSPYLLTTAVGGWLSYGVLLDGALPHTTVRGSLSEEQAVGQFLRARGIHYTAADYWVAYRLSFVLAQNPIVVPEASEDRYPKWRTEFDAARKVAYLLHPSSPMLTVETIEAQLLTQGLKFEKVRVQQFTVLLVDR